MEKVAQAKARSGGSENTLISSVRYGNVMYSRGSSDSAVREADSRGQAADGD